MIIWFAAGSAAVVWVVFRSPAVDYRTVMLGSVLPLLEAPFGIGPMQSLVCSVLVLTGVMLATIGRRLVRRRWLGVPIGMFLYLVLSGAFMHPDSFWWPLRGWAFPDGDAYVLARGWWSLLWELVGVVIALWLWGEFGLDDDDRRRRFMGTGQLDRTYVDVRPGLGGDD